MKLPRPEKKPPAVTVAMTAEPAACTFESYAIVLTSWVVAGDKPGSTVGLHGDRVVDQTRRAQRNGWTAVARRDGVNRTAATLHLDGGKLKRRMLETAKPVSRKERPPAFVELTSLANTDLPEYTLELEGHSGKLRIHCKGATATELALLSRALWDIAG